MNNDVLVELGLAKNEAIIYETLLTEGESSVGHIAVKSKIHRRNVYDSLNRLVEKGLVFEILERHENHYQAVDPNKLTEMLDEKRQLLAKAMPNLMSLYTGTPRKNEVYISRGVEGWKNYMRDILRLGQDNYTLAAKGAWADPKLAPMFESFLKEAQRKGIKFHVLYDETTKTTHPEFIKALGDQCRFLPAEYGTEASIDIFADRVVILPHGEINSYLDEDSAFTVIVNQQIADAFRTWFKLMWDFCPPIKKRS